MTGTGTATATSLRTTGAGGTRRIPLAVFFVNLALSGNNALVAATLYRLTGSASNFALVLISNFAIAALVQLVAGQVVDRMGAGRLAVVSETFACGAIALEAVLSLRAHPATAMVGAAALVSVVQAFYRAAMFSLSPQLAAKERLASLNARINAAFQAGTLLGAPLGMLMLCFRPVFWGFAVLALSFATAAGILKSLPRKSPAVPGAGGSQDERGGLIRALCEQRGLMLHIVICSGDYVAVSMFTLIVVPLATDRFGGGTLTMALVNAALPAGVILSTLVPWGARSNGNPLTLLTASMSALLAAFLLLLPSWGLLVTLLCVAVVGFTAGCSQTLLMTALQVRTPREVLGRVGSLRLFVASALGAPTLALASYLLDSGGVRTALMYCAGVEGLYLACVLALSRRCLWGDRLFMSREAASSNAGEAAG
ncbi:MFS transporter [Streptomyces sp. NPDC059456]|uniref:MFS transporter n=1 Tax=Streptomyces sp. NPDC059456 TaxID=3346838 RepID=UPI0036D1081E